MLKYKKIFLLLIVAVPALQSFAQKGMFITPYGGVQMSTIANSRDYYIKELKFKYKARPVYGLMLDYNFTDIFGLETGLRYSAEGQKYTGHITYDVNTRDSVNIYFNSACNLNYFQIPLLLRFNSSLDEDKVYMNISAGVQLDILKNASMTVSPGMQDSLNLGSDVSGMFRTYTGSFVANAGLNIQLSKKVYLYTGLQMSKSISDIENKKFKFNANKMGFEYVFPIGVKKEDYPQDYTTRNKTKNIVYSFLVGISIKVK